MATTYSTDSEVSEKYSHLQIPTSITVANYRDEAYNHINIMLRPLYVVPIDSPDAIDISYLKSIESRLAAGNILIAVGSSAEIENIHEYGLKLIEQAEAKLQALIDQKIILEGATQDTDDEGEVINPPRILGSASDSYATFERPMSGIENDAIEGVVDSEAYNSLEDVKE